MSNYPWLDEARKHIGLEEVVGVQHNPEVLQMWKDIRRGGIKDDETPWCAAFVGAMLERVGVHSSRFESATSYLNWGIELQRPVTGCIVVFTRVGGGHVGFATGKTVDGNLLVLGGNQSDAVNIRAFELGRVSGYRWPAGVPVVDEPLAVVADDVPLSSTEA
ncbi:TIGR02594 family protein [Pseudomonas sp. UBA4617]|uniref:TIGR02594 family protein n=1 Tax=Pseudomonas sp. UBA4617 TaxID=1947318 RepID=UPI0025F0BE20|nr:TIGR02594 family protein [Pseudomonas sp. UBA4617]